MGAPEKLQMNKLESWTLNTDEGVKYFSGTADYVTTFDAPKKWFQSGSEFLLDMGKVGDIAEVTLNGTPLGTFWKAPYQVDITNVLKKGENRLEIKVTNQWTNRLIGDMKTASGKKVLNSTLRVFPGQKMNDSGLLGPVTIVMKP
jgi:beta-galactosidase/beta-glucuronidase